MADLRTHATDRPDLKRRACQGPAAWMVLAGVVALAGCAARETPYMTRLRAQCTAGDPVGCESLASLKTNAQTPRGRSGGSGDIGGFLIDVGAAVVTLP